MSETIKDTASFLAQNDNYVIGIHANPDGDCLGSALGLCGVLKKLGKECLILSPMDIPERLKFLNYTCQDILVGKAGLEALEGQSHTFITVDVASNHLLDTLNEHFEQHNEFAIDHHSNNSITSKRLYLESDASAAGEIVYKIVRELEALTNKDLFDEYIASDIFGAISSDTGCFKYSNVTPSTHIIAADLIRRGAFASDINYRLFDLKSSVQIAVETLAYKKLSFFNEGKISFIYISDDELKEIGAKASDTETVCQLGRGIVGVQVAAFMRQKEEGLYKVSVRSNNDMDMALLCASFGIGGGHRKAAGCSIYAESPEKAQEIFLEKAAEYIE